jgi:hypothetical protein
MRLSVLRQETHGLNARATCTPVGAPTRLITLTPLRHDGRGSENALEHEHQD